MHAIYPKALRGRSAYGVRFVFDIRQDQADSAARLFDAQAVSIDELVQRAEVILITTPPDTHAALLNACLLPKKIVVCEKPFVTSYRDAIELTRKAESESAQLYVGHVRRTFPQVLLARSLIQLGVIGNVREIYASEGGRFTWKAVSNYVVTNPHGGVLWDTGTHTLDMALFAAGVDEWPDCSVDRVIVERDKPEPSHDFRGQAVIARTNPAREIACRVHLSRKTVLPNFIRLIGDHGSIAFLVGMDRYVRLTTNNGSIVLTSEQHPADLLESFDLQFRRILMKQNDRQFSAVRVLALTKTLEALHDA